MQKVQTQSASSPQTSHSQTGASLRLKRRRGSRPSRPSRSSTTRNFNSVEVSGGAKVVYVLETAAFAQYLTDLCLHAMFVGITERPAWLHPARDHVSVAFYVEGTEVTTAFQPSLPQEVVQIFEGGVGLYLYIHPEDGREGVLDPQTKEPCGLSPGRFVLSQTAPQVARHRRFGSALAAEGADTVGGKLAHAGHSIHVFWQAKCTSGIRFEPRRAGRAGRSGRVGHRKIAKACWCPGASR